MLLNLQEEQSTIDLENSFSTVTAAYCVYKESRFIADAASSRFSFSNGFCILYVNLDDATSENNDCDVSVRLMVTHEDEDEQALI
ncbi:hypothetical protein E3N88_14804 [Mikania micrantha]|uniref:Uncharacterized protein n=1 Tax=Mikania micrantha TaxID=192012 RepID=A0A5N6P2H1_9ASTR|nr:hypothetical protein E3N88_14804 [Mikania micrantha]